MGLTREDYARVDQRRETVGPLGTRIPRARRDWSVPLIIIGWAAVVLLLSFVNDLGRMLEAAR